MTEDMNKMTDTTTTDQPPAPNGHGTNGVTHGAPHQEATAKDAPRKTKAERKAEKKAAAAAAAAATNTSSTPAPEVDPSPENPPTMEAVPAPAPAAPTEAPAAPPIETTAQASIEAPVERLRVRMKIWTHPQTGKRYLMSNAYMRDVRNGQPMSDVMVAYAMRDDDTMMVTLRADQWNALPFFYMQEDGPAPRASARPMDVISRGKP